MGNKYCPYFVKSSTGIEYCGLKPHEEGENGNYRFVACDFKKRWELCGLVLEKQANDLEKELDKF